MVDGERLGPAGVINGRWRQTTNRPSGRPAELPVALPMEEPAGLPTVEFAVLPAEELRNILELLPLPR